MTSLEDIEAKRRAFEAWVESFAVYNRIDPGVSLPENVSNDHIWTEVQTYTESVIYFGHFDNALIERMGLQPFDVTGYYFSEKPWQGNHAEASGVVAGDFLDCKACKNTGRIHVDDDYEECETCDFNENWVSFHTPDMRQG